MRLHGLRGDHDVRTVRSGTLGDRQADASGASCHKGLCGRRAWSWRDVARSMHATAEDTTPGHHRSFLGGASRATPTRRWASVGSSPGTGRGLTPHQGTVQASTMAHGQVAGGALRWALTDGALATSLVGGVRDYLRSRAFLVPLLTQDIYNFTTIL